MLIVVGIVVGLVIPASMHGPQASFITEQFPTRVRYAGSSLTYTFAGVVSDGFTPLIIVTVFEAAGATWAISTYVTITLAITLVSLLVARENRRTRARRMTNPHLSRAVHAARDAAALMAASLNTIPIGNVAGKRAAPRRCRGFRQRIQSARP